MNSGLTRTNFLLPAPHNKICKKLWILPPKFYSRRPHIVDDTLFLLALFDRFLEIFILFYKRYAFVNADLLIFAENIFFIEENIELFFFM